MNIHLNAPHKDVQYPFFKHGLLKDFLNLRYGIQRKKIKMSISRRMERRIGKA
jgi:hypothetical protein